MAPRLAACAGGCLAGVRRARRWPEPGPGAATGRHQRAGRQRRRRHRGDPGRGQPAHRGGDHPQLHGGRDRRPVRSGQARSVAQEPVSPPACSTTSPCAARATRWSSPWSRTRSSTGSRSRATSASTTRRLSNEVQLRPRVVYTRSRVQNAVSRILELYRRNGRFAATVEPKVIELPQNRVDLVFEINEGAAHRGLADRLHRQQGVQRQRRCAASSRPRRRPGTAS